MKLSVIVGRFQSDFIHDGYKALFKQALQTNEKLLIILGESVGLIDERNPLSLKERKLILSQYFQPMNLLHRIEFRSIKDTKENETWYKNLANIVSAYFESHEAGNSADNHVSFHYGVGKDSAFQHDKEHYVKFAFSSKKINIEFKGIQCSDYHSSTKSRNQLLSIYKEELMVPAYNSLLLGKLLVLEAQYPTALTTVDAIVMSGNAILLGKKHGETLWRLPGGFVDPKLDVNYKAAVIRECEEEINLKSSDILSIEYLGNSKVNDWRYINSKHKVFTNVFKIILSANQPLDLVAGDDLEKIQWYHLNHDDSDFSKLSTQIIPEHFKLIQLFKEQILCGI